jgi:hypothetical protein
MNPPHNLVCSRINRNQTGRRAYCHIKAVTRSTGGKTVSVVQPHLDTAKYLVIWQLNDRDIVTATVSHIENFRNSISLTSTWALKQHKHYQN